MRPKKWKENIFMFVLIWKIFIFSIFVNAERAIFGRLICNRRRFHISKKVHFLFWLKISTTIVHLRHSGIELNIVFPMHNLQFWRQNALKLVFLSSNRMSSTLSSGDTCMSWSCLRTLYLNNYLLSINFQISLQLKT